MEKKKKARNKKEEPPKKTSQVKKEAVKKGKEEEAKTAERKILPALNEAIKDEMPKAEIPKIVLLKPEILKDEVPTKEIAPKKDNAPVLIIEEPKNSSEIKTEPKTEPKIELKIEPKIGPKTETKVEPKTEVKIEPKPISSAADPGSNQQKVEALLFSYGKKMDVADIAHICEISSEAAVLKCLNNLKKEYEDRKSALMFVDEGKSWKITVREAFLPVVRKIVADTELSKSVMETLAVIAWKFPISQNNVIKIRTNKAYDHIKELEEMGFIKKERSGRTYALKLTDKFFSYFDVSGKNIKEMLEKIGEKMPKEKAKKLGDLTVYTEEAPKKEEVQKPGEEKIKIGALEVYGVPEKEKLDLDIPVRESDDGPAAKKESKVPIDKENSEDEKEEEPEEEPEEESEEESESEEVVEREVEDKKRSSKDELKEESEEEGDEETKDDSEDEEDDKKEKEESDDEEPPKRVISDELANMISGIPGLNISKKRKKPIDEDEEKEEDEESDDK